LAWWFFFLFFFLKFLLRDNFLPFTDKLCAEFLDGCLTFFIVLVIKIWEWLNCLSNLGGWQLGSCHFSCWKLTDNCKYFLNTYFFVLSQFISEFNQLIVCKVISWHFYILKSVPFRCLSFVSFFFKFSCRSLSKIEYLIFCIKNSPFPAVGSFNLMEILIFFLIFFSLFVSLF